MKNFKFIDSINFICLFFAIYNLTMFFVIFVLLFKLNPIVDTVLNTVLLPVWLFMDIFPILSLLPIIILFIFFGTAELFLIIEKNKFEKYFFPYFSDKARRRIKKISVLGFIINILLTIMLCLGALF